MAQPAAALLPPGPKGMPVVGTGLEFARDPLGFLTRCARDYGDIVSTRFFHIPAVLVSRAEMIEEVLVAKNANFIKSVDLKETRNVLGEGLLTSEGKFWQRQRKLVQPAFHRDRIAAYARVFTEFGERTIASWKDGETRNIHADMMQLAVEIAAKTLFDTDVSSDAREIGDALAAVLRQYDARGRTGFLIPPSVPLPANLRGNRAIRRLDRIVYRIIAQRRAAPGDRRDLLSMLLEARDEDGRPMDDRQLRDESITLLLAGHETTAIALSWTWLLLSENPGVEAKLHAELAAVLSGRTPAFEDIPRLVYTDKVIRESMRLYPPAWGIGREAVADCEIGGYFVPAGTNVYLSQWVTHRLARYFPEPERFLPERWTEEFARKLPKFAYFPFGGGPRVCVGASFAMMEAVLLLATIAQRASLRLVPGEPVRPWPSITLRPERGIPVTVARR